MARRRDRSLLHAVVPDRPEEIVTLDDVTQTPGVVPPVGAAAAPTRAPSAREVAPPAPAIDPIRDAELALLDLVGRAVRGDWASLAATTLRQVARTMDVHELVCGGTPSRSPGSVLDVAGLERRTGAALLAHEAIRHDLEAVTDRLHHEPASRLRDRVAELADRVGRHRRDIGRSTPA